MGERANRPWKNIRDQYYSGRYGKTYRGDYEENVSKLGGLGSGKCGERGNK